ncbi:MAG: hypothetical protein ABIN36_05970 [Ferruginibacter sp.]
MKPLIVLLSAFAISLIVTKISIGRYEFALSGRIALSVMLMFTAIAHFAFTKGMEMMLPTFIPYKKEVVYLTGIIEFAAATGIHIPAFRAIAALLLIVFFILIVPANIYAAVKHIDYQKANYNGGGPNYLMFRIPLQVFFILWTYIFAVKYN